MATNSGPLSEQMWPGMPRCRNRSDKDIDHVLLAPFEFGEQ